MATASIITLDQVTLKMDTTDKGWQTGAWIPYNNMELPSSPGPPASRFFFLHLVKASNLLKLLLLEIPLSPAAKCKPK